MRQYLPMVVAAALIILGGTVYGYRTNRWVLAPALQHAVIHLPELPFTIGDWQGQDTEMDESARETFKRAECHAWLVRRYVHRLTGDAVSVMIVCGPTGPIATHDPRACYGGGGYAMAGPPEHRELPFGSEPTPAAFSSGNFRRTDSPSPLGLKIYWAFHAGEGWQASDNPRVDFAAARAIYKIYVIREVVLAEGSDVDDSVSPQFILELLPELERRTLLADPDRVVLVLKGT